MANPLSTSELLDLVRKSGIVRAEILEEKLRDAQPLPDDPGRTATYLVREGVLTKFQAKLLLTGKYRGFRLGPYIIQDQIGQGGMGAVYLAVHETLRRKVALKVLTPASVDGQLSIERFLREARAAAALDHPNIVRIFDVAAHGDTHYLVMEYVEGETLESLMEKAGAIPCGRAVAYVTQALAGLQHAHERGFVHRDIKPANLMLARDGTIKILDMGLARSVTQQSDKLTELMDQGAVVGTADYIAPEQALNSPTVDVRADIYSLGATFYALATGRPPFSGNTTQKLMQHQMKEAPSLCEVDQTFPPGLALIVAKMMRKKPEDRYQTPGEAIAALAPWVPGSVTAKVVAGLSKTDIASNVELQNTLTEMVGGSTRRLPKPAVEDEPAPGLMDRWPVIVAGIAAVLLVGVGALIYALNSSEPTRLGVEVKDTSPQISPAWTPPKQAAPKKAASKGTSSKGTPAKKGPPPTQPVTARLAREVYRLDLKSQQPFTERGRVVIPDQAKPAVKKWQSLAKTGTGQLPPGWVARSHNPASEVEYIAATHHGSLALGSRNLRGPGSAMLFAPPFTLPSGTARLRFEYLTDLAKGPYTLRFLQTGPERKQAWTVCEIPATGGVWRTEELTVDLKGASAGFFEFHNNVADPAAGFWLRAVTVSESGEIERLAYKLDLAGPGPGGWGGAAGAAVPVAGGGAAGEQSLGPAAAMESPAIDLPGGRARLRFEYRTDGTAAPTSLAFRPVKPVPAAAWDVEKALPATDGRWVTREIEVETRGAIAGSFEFRNSGPAQGGALRLRAFEVYEVHVPGEGAVVYRFDPAAIPPFKNRKEGGKLVSGPREQMPRGTSLRGWKKETLAEFSRDVVDGAPAVAMTQFTNIVSAQLAIELEKTDGTGATLGLTAGREYIVRVTYRTTGEAVASSYIQTQGDHRSVANKALPNTGGNWQTAEYTFRKPDQPVRLLVDLREKGDGNTLYVREVVVAEREAAAASAPQPAASVTETVGPPLFRLNTAGVAPFRFTVAEKMSNGEKPRLADVEMHCWRAESVAEFRGEADAGGLALAVTNLNDALSSQVLFRLEKTGAEPGREYVARLEYRTINDASGNLIVRGEKYARLQQTPLAGTGGQWQTAEVRFTRPVGLALDAVVENRAVGEGNTLFVRRFELLQVK